MTCKRSKQCDNAYICQLAQSKEYHLLGGSCFTPKDPQTNEEWLRSATFEEMAGAIYEWHSAGYTSGRVGLGLNPVTEVVEWLKQPHEDTK